MGPTKWGKGTKWMVVVDGQGLPVGKQRVSASSHESRFIEATVQYDLAPAKVQRLIYDKAADGNALRERMAEAGIDQFAPELRSPACRIGARVENGTTDRGRHYSVLHPSVLVRCYARRPCVSETPAPIRLVHMVTVVDSLIFIGGQTDYLRTRGLQTWVVCSPGEELEQFGQDHDAQTLGVKMSRAIAPAKDLAALLNVWRCFRRVRPQIVHAGTPKGGLLGMVAARLVGVPVCIYQMRGLPLVTARGLRRKLLWWCEKLACSLSHRVLCDSESLRVVALAERLCSREKAVVIAKGSCQGVDAAGRFNPEHHHDRGADMRAALGIPQNAVLIGFVGRIVRDKGIEELVTAWQRLREEFPDLHLAIAGKAEPGNPISMECTETLDTDPQIHLLGWIADTPAFYAAVDMIVLPTYREGFPNVPLEAAAMALPVVSTRIPGCIDAVEDGVTGTLVSAADAQDLAVAIARYITEPLLRCVHGRAGRKRVLECFRPETIWESLYHEYLTLLRQRSPGAVADE